MLRLGMAICPHGAEQAKEPTPGVAVPSASLKEAMPGSALLSRHRKVNVCPLLSRTMKQLRLCSSMSHGGGNGAAALPAWDALEPGSLPNVPSKEPSIVRRRSRGSLPRLHLRLVLVPKQIFGGCVRLFRPMHL